MECLFLNRRRHSLLLRKIGPPQASVQAAMKLGDAEFYVEMATTMQTVKPRKQRRLRVERLSRVRTSRS